MLVEDPPPVAAPLSSSALAALVATVEGTIHNIANDYRRGLSPDQIEDLISAGRVGALIAARRHDPDRDANYNTYATYWIRAYIVNEAIFFWGRGRFKATTDAARAVFFRRGRAKRAVEGPQGEEAGALAVASVIGISPNLLADVEATVNGDDRSFDDPCQLVRGQPLREVVEDAAASTSFDTTKMSLNQVRTAMSTVLDARSCSIIELRYFYGMKLEEVGREVGLTRERVRQIERKALDALRKHLSR